jgi:hypothetical protein
VTVTHHIPSKCPACEHTIDAAGTIDGNDTYVAAPGDLTICFGCGCMLIYATDMTVRLPTPQELVELPPEQLKEAEDVQKKIKLLKDIFPGQKEPPPG